MRTMKPLHWAGVDYSLLQILLAALLLCSRPFAVADKNDALHRPRRNSSPTKRAGSIPLLITNRCGETLWPGIETQEGTAPEEGGFELAAGKSKNLTVGGDWQGRIWGRTNCSFNADGTASSKGDNTAACDSGDCGGVLNCVVTGSTPVTLAEFDLSGGVNKNQTFYDISLVDGYNLPLSIIYLPGDNPKLQDIPPNLTNPACIATAGHLADPAPSGWNGGASNSSYPIPYEDSMSSTDVAKWCPWPLQVKQPTKPGAGIYPYPDDHIERPIFDPCLSGCAKTNSPEDCCTGKYKDPNKCKPNLFAKAAKAVCPDAYSYAFDDQTSTFIIPNGGGWEIRFCPEGRSTNILKTFSTQLHELNAAGGATKSIQEACRNRTLIREAGRSGAGRTRDGLRGMSGNLVALLMVVSWIGFIFY
ncbi:Osmotin, thaumatin-like protein [Venustampulla echinocandica]|uniref:Osmotin, thaumatin-like protein n=1 Tax=Venustampulla echinocandica TaxID=2656787 RepID=A0A370TZX4_9HELO|nr:Osmotin, thaumatin-like protein [Venustampulla echinocandica]RDL41082.1 Osmotin, thaumatin-like protein [Venustampulla echinocandica]